MKQEIIVLVVYLIVIVLVIGLITQVVWNSLISDIFSLRQISYLESVVLNIFFRISFQGFEFNPKE
jgi:hypothetical protein